MPVSELAYIAKASIYGRVNHSGDEEQAKAIHALGAPQRLVDFIRKGAMTLAVIEGTTGSQLASFSDNFLQNAVPQSAFLRMIADNAIRSVPRGTPGIISVSSATANVVGEAQPVPVSSMAFKSLTAALMTVSAIVSGTVELLGQMTPPAMRFLDGEMRRAVGTGIDNAAFAVILLDPFATLAVMSVDAEGVLVAAQSALIAVTADEGSDPNTLYWVCDPTAAAVLSTVNSGVVTGGAPAFPSASVNGGELLGLPLLVSRALGEGELALIDASGVSASLSQIVVETSTQAALDFGVPPSTPPSAVVSLWQTNSVAVRAQCSLSVERFSRRAAVLITGVTASGAT